MGLGMKIARRNNRPTCPYCKGEVDRAEAATACPKCRTAHHRECARALERCAIMGCGASLVEAPARLPVAPQRTTTTTPTPAFDSYSSNGGCLGFFGDIFADILVQGVFELVFSAIFSLF